ncbi:unnamed protein product, partial [Polarella glacialis]
FPLLSLAEFLRLQHLASADELPPSAAAQELLGESSPLLQRLRLRLWAIRSCGDCEGEAKEEQQEQDNEQGGEANALRVDAQIKLEVKQEDEEAAEGAAAGGVLEDGYGGEPQ